MVGTLTNTRLHFEKGTMERRNHFGFPFTSFAIFIMFCLILTLGEQRTIFIVITIGLAVISFVSYSIQRKKLNLRELNLQKSENLYSSIKAVLLKNGWTINANNKKTIIQATYNVGSISSELLTFDLTSEKVKYNSIRNPYDNSSIRTFFYRNKNGMKIIRELSSAFA